MRRCFNCEAFYISELLVFVSSCLYVVMTILVAVVSVTNTIFQTDYPEELGIICSLPSSYILPESADINDIKKGSDNSNLSLVIESYLSTLLRLSLVQNGYISNNEAIDVDMSLPEIMKFDSIFKLSQSFSIPKTLIFAPTNSSNLISATIQTGSYISSIEDAQNYIKNNNLPLLLTIPHFYFSGSNSKCKTKSNEYFLPDTYSLGEYETFIIYGWNGDYNPRSQIYKKYLKKGGFYAKSLSNTKGHSISYLNGIITSSEEDFLCSSSPVSNGSEVICSLNSCCEVGKKYFFSHFDEENQKEVFYDETKSKLISLPLGAAGNCFDEKFDTDERLFTASTLCSYHFIPYDIIETAISINTQQNYINSPMFFVFDVNWDLNQASGLPKIVLKKRPTSVFNKSIS